MNEEKIIRCKDCEYRSACSIKEAAGFDGSGFCSNAKQVKKKKLCGLRSTGVHDSNDNRLYENDRVRFDNGEICFEGTVKYEGGAFGIATEDILTIPCARCDYFITLWELIWEYGEVDNGYYSVRYVTRREEKT